MKIDHWLSNLLTPSQPATKYSRTISSKSGVLTLADGSKAHILLVKVDVSLPGRTIVLVIISDEHNFTLLVIDFIMDSKLQLNISEWNFNFCWWRRPCHECWRSFGLIVWEMKIFCKELFWRNVNFTKISKRVSYFQAVRTYSCHKI